MPFRTMLMAGVAAAVANSVVSAQTVDTFGNCVNSAQVTSFQAATANSCLVTQQSQIVSTRGVPAEARLLSSRVVATGWAPASSLNSQLSFGTGSAPLASSFLSSSAATVQPLTTFGVQSTFGLPATFAAPAFSTPTTFTLAPQTVTNTLPVVVPSSAVNVLATRIANDDLRSSAINAQASPNLCCSAKSLESLSGRLEVLDANLERLENSIGNSAGGGRTSDDEIDKLLGGSEKAREQEPEPSGDFIDELLNGAD